MFAEVGNAVGPAACTGGAVLLRANESDEDFALILASANGSISSFACSANKLNRQANELGNVGSSCSSIASNGSNWLVATGFSGHVSEMLVKDSKCIETFRWTFNSVPTCSTINDNDMYVGYEHGKISQLRSQCLVPTWQASREISATSITTMSRDSIWVASGKSVIAYDVRAGGNVSQVIESNEAISSITCADSIIFGGSVHGQVHGWDFRKTQTPIRSEIRHEGSVTTLFSLDVGQPERELYSSGSDGTVRLRPGEPILKTHCPIRQMIPMKLSESTNLVWIAAVDGTLALYSAGGQIVQGSKRMRKGLALPTNVDDE